MKDLEFAPLRLGLGIVFLYHGLQKAFGFFGGSGVEGFAVMLSNLGFFLPKPLAYIVAYVELLGGLFLIIGLAAKIVTVFLIFIMAVALFKVHLANGFSFMAGGYEYNFVLICALFTLFLVSPGKISLTKKK